MKIITVPLNIFGGLFFALLFCVLPNQGSAASLYIDPANSNLHRGDSVTLAVRLNVDDSSGECVNAVDAVIHYSGKIEPVDTSIGNSILRVWVQEPVIDTEAKTISFAGGIPNGYCGRVIGDPRLTNVIAEIVFWSPSFSVSKGADDELSEVSFSDSTTLYLNDGLGTKAKTNVYSAEITIDETPRTEITNEWGDRVKEDVIRPEEFSINLQKQEKEFNGQYYIVFSTTDKQTGISEYQIMEEPVTQFGSFEWGRADAPWVEARSPYVLKDQSLNSVIRVRAIDKAGNEYVAVYVPDPTIRTMSQNQLHTYIAVSISLVLLLITIFVIFKLLKRRKLRHSINRSDDEANVVKERSASINEQ